jgi:hypothetical protein
MAATHLAGAWLAPQHSRGGARRRGGSRGVCLRALLAPPAQCHTPLRLLHRSASRPCKAFVTSRPLPVAVCRASGEEGSKGRGGGWWPFSRDQPALPAPPPQPPPLPPPPPFQQQQPPQQQQQQRQAAAPPPDPWSAGQQQRQQQGGGSGLLGARSKWDFFGAGGTSQAPPPPPPPPPQQPRQDDPWAQRQQGQAQRKEARRQARREQPQQPQPGEQQQQQARRQRWVGGKSFNERLGEYTQETNPQWRWPSVGAPPAAGLQPARHLLLAPSLSRVPGSPAR